MRNKAFLNFAGTFQKPAYITKIMDSVFKRKAVVSFKFP